MQTIITSAVIDGRTYYEATRNGVKYCAGVLGGRWFVSSHRISLGRHAGGGKYYDSLAAVAAGCKAFAGLDILAN